MSYSQGHSSLPIGRLLQIEKVTTSYLRDTKKAFPKKTGGDGRIEELDKIPLS